MENLNFYPDLNDIGSRIDVYLTDEMPEFSRSSVQKFIENGLVSINNKQAKSNHKLKHGDVISVEIMEDERIDVKAENLDLDIMYEDEHLVVVNKPQGMVVHPAKGHYSGTLVNGLLYHCGESLSGINGVLRPGIVHRIDRDTSGVLVIAKSNIAHRELASQLSLHTMKRVYNAITHFHIKEDIGTIDKPIGRNPNERKKMTVLPIGSRSGKRAVTHYKVISRLIHNASKVTLVEVQLETGRTHQIRVHLLSIGHPIIGDPVYGMEKSAFKLNGQALHARILGFVHPVTNEYMEFEASLPQYLVDISGGI